MSFFKNKSNMLACILAIVSASQWQFLLGMQMADNNITAQIGVLFLVMGGYFLFKQAFTLNDKRLLCIAYVLGFVFSAIVMVGLPLRNAPHYDTPTLGGICLALLRFLSYGISFGAMISLAYNQLLIYRAKPLPTCKESLLSKITGNFGFLCLFFALCWLPIWWAFYPGSFTADSVTQFWEYYYSDFSTHHPLLHTFFLGACMAYGLDNTMEGLPSTGIAIYCLIQTAILCLIFAYSLWWLRKHRAPLWARLGLTGFFGLFPFYPLWTFSAQKDILFSAFIVMFLLLLIDIGNDRGKRLATFVRIVACIFFAVGLMLLRNNGIYALCVAIPFMVLFFKGARLRLTAVATVSVVSAMLISSALTNYVSATVPCKIELLSVPLQQISRTLKEYPEAIDVDTDGVIQTLYAEKNPADSYHEMISDPVRWNAIYDHVDENLVPLFKLWIKMGVAYPATFTEAFVIQNLPYLVPGSPMLYYFDLPVREIEMFPVEQFNFMPPVKEVYSHYGETLNFMSLPFVSLLSDAAFYVWLALFMFGYALYLKQTHIMAVLCFLFAIWLSCLMGPVAIPRYMLAFFYVIPLLFVYMLKEPCHKKS